MSVNITPMQQILSGMQSAQWYDHFRGALYPLRLEQCSVQHTPGVKTLTQIAADYIVKDSTMTLNALESLPQDLCTVLMQQALEGNKDRAVDVLLTKWPLNTLSLKKFAPEIFTSLALLHNHMELTRVAKQGLRYTTSVAHNFLETLKNKCPTKLKFVDLSDFPTAEVISYYLATHCMLAHNEARQNMMIRKYEEAIKFLPAEESAGKLEHFTTDQSLPDDYFAVKLDVFITSEPALCEVSKALKVSGFRESTLRLIVNKLDVTCLGAQHLDVLLEQVNPEFLQGLRLKYNSLNATGFVKLCPLIERFKHMTALDLSCNAINIFQNDNACDKMKDLFSKLTNLVRLDLSNNILRGKLRRILTCVEKPLLYLRLAGCGLSLSDITYLSVSHHTEALHELDLSENGLGNCITALRHLFKCIKTKVCILELEDSTLEDSHCTILVESLKILSSLLYLNMIGNSLTKDSMRRIGESVAGLQNLQFLCLSYPSDCYNGYSTEVQEQNKKEFAAEFEDVIHREQSRLNIPNRIPNIEFSELEQELDLI